MPLKTVRMLVVVVFVGLLQLEMGMVLAECNSTIVQTNIEKCFETHNTDTANPTICGNPDNIISCLDNSIVTCSDLEVGVWRNVISRYHANLIQLCASGSTQNPYCNNLELLSGYVTCFLSMENNTCSSYRAVENCYFGVISNCSLSSPVLASHTYLILLEHSVELICEYTGTGPCGYNAFASCLMFMPQNASEVKMEELCMIMTQTEVCLEAFLALCPDTTYITQEQINSTFASYNHLCSSGCNLTQLFDDMGKCGNPEDMSSMTCDDLIVGLGCIEDAVALANCYMETVDTIGLIGQARAYVAANCTDGTTQITITNNAEGTTEMITNANSAEGTTQITITNNAEGTTEMITNSNSAEGTTQITITNNAEAPKLYIRLAGLVLVISMAFI